MLAHHEVLASLDVLQGALSPIEELVLLLEEVVLDGLLLLQDTLIDPQNVVDIGADCLGHDELAA